MFFKISFFHFTLIIKTWKKDSVINNYLSWHKVFLYIFYGMHEKHIGINLIHPESWCTYIHHRWNKVNRDIFVAGPPIESYTNWVDTSLSSQYRQYITSYITWYLDNDIQYTPPHTLLYSKYWILNSSTTPNI